MIASLTTSEKEPIDRRMDLLSMKHENSSSSLNSATGVTKEIVESLTPNMLQGDQTDDTVLFKKKSIEPVQPEEELEQAEEM